MKVAELYDKYAEELDLELFAGIRGLKRSISIPEIERPGLSLVGYLKGMSHKRILVFGKTEITYLKELPLPERLLSLRRILLSNTPAVIVTRYQRPLKEMIEICEELNISLFRSKLITMKLQTRLLILLADQFAPMVCCHGSFVDVAGVGVLIQGDSAVGKSEAALGLIQKGHRLIADDFVKVRKLDSGFLEGYGAEMTRHHMEVRGIGIINVANLYGAACVAEKKNLDLVVKLEVWNDSHFYDRSGLEEKTLSILGIEVPHHLLPLKPGRDVVLLLETLALNHRLKIAGIYAAREFDHKLQSVIERKHNRHHG